ELSDTGVEQREALTPDAQHLDGLANFTPKDIRREPARYRPLAGRAAGAAHLAIGLVHAHDRAGAAELVVGVSAEDERSVTGLEQPRDAGLATGSRDGSDPGPVSSVETYRSASQSSPPGAIGGRPDGETPSATA